MKASFVLATVLVLILAQTSIKAQACSDLFFSEYIEGSSSNKALEIYNPTGNVIDLSNYVIYRNNNGSLSPTDSLFPVGMLEQRDVFVVGNPSANTTISIQSDTTHTLSFYNGDDAVWLRNKFTGDTLDIIGDIGVDPGSGWIVGTGATNNFTLIRRILQRKGTNNWTLGATEWDVFPIDMDDSLGTHSMSISDCDIATIRYKTRFSQENEAANNVEAEVLLSKSSLDTVRVKYSISGTATANGEDHSLVDGELIFSPGDTSQVIMLPISNDDVIEENETIEITITEIENGFLPSKNHSSGNLRVFTHTIVNDDTPFAAGDGTEINPYQISTLDELQAIKDYLDSHFILMNDINASSSSGWNEGAGFIPIGNNNDPFNGSLNGNEFEVDSLFINRPSTNNVGLFGYTSSSAVIKKLELSNVSITGLAGSGALIGTNYGAIMQSSSSGNISGGIFLGGLTGFNSGEIIQSSSSVTVTGNDTDAGGLAGGNEGAIIDSYALGSVRGQFNIGGLVGSNSGDIKKSYANGNVEGGEYVGGLVGENNGVILNSYSLSEFIFGDNNSGGLVGINNNEGSITNSYATGEVLPNPPNTRLGGLVGSNFGSIVSSFWDTQTSTQSIGVGDGSATGVTGKTTIEMQQRSTFKDIGWNFNTVWDIDEGESYPFFKIGNDFELTITGNEGWRMLSTPEGKSTYEAFLYNTWSQGFTGAKSEAGNPSVLLWDEANRNWMAPNSSTDSTQRGQGFLGYLFADDDNDGNPEGFPKDLIIKIEPDTGEVSIPVSFTNTDSISKDGWNFVGNPFGETIDWDSDQGFSRTNLSNSIYVWSDSAGGGQGAYLTWNGKTGTLPDGKIAPWQGFWVKAMGENPEFDIYPSAKMESEADLESDFYTHLELKVTSGEYHSTAIMFADLDAFSNVDANRAYAISSLNDTSLILAFQPNGIHTGITPPLQIAYLTNGVGIDIVIDAVNVDSTMEFSWKGQHLGAGGIRLIDEQENVDFDLTGEGSYSFEFEGVRREGSESADSLGIPPKPTQLVNGWTVGQVINEEIRFRIFYDHGPLSSESGIELPKTIELSQNYPNPFNPSTTINYGVPEESAVSLEVFDMLGRKVATLVESEIKQAGRYSVQFDASNLSSGMYFYRLQTDGKVLIQKMTLIK